MSDMTVKKVEENPEVVEKVGRRRFTREYKQRIAREAEACSEPGEIGALLRREGLHSSSLNRWRTQLRGSSLSSSKKPTQKKNLSEENKQLKRENERLSEKLRQAELIIDVQKKVSEMIQTRSQEKID